MRRLLTGLGATVLLAGAGLLGATPAAATALPMNQCSTSSGAIVAVDFGHWGGPIVRGCGSTPTTGFQLLNQGGFQTTGTRHDGPGFICRISSSGYPGGAQPTLQDDPCVNTPPATAYWSYWHANPGASSWSYSQDGAQSYSPLPGSVDLWTFGSGGSPSVSPDALRAHNSPSGSSAPASAPHSSAPGGSGSGSGGSGSGSGSGSGGSGSGSSSAGSGGSGGLSGATIGSLSPLRPGGSVKSKGAASPARSSAASSTTAGSGTSSASPSGSKSIVNADPTATPRHHSSGSMIPGLITVVLVLGSIAAALGWRRRHG